MKVLLELHAICARTDLQIESIDVQDKEGRPKWLLGVSEILSVDMLGDKYTADDFVKAFRRVTEEKLQQLDLERQQEIQLIIEEQKVRWDTQASKGTADDMTSQQMG